MRGKIEKEYDIVSKEGEKMQKNTGGRGSEGEAR